MLLVIFPDLHRGDDDVLACLGLTHGLNGDLVFLVIAETRHGVALRLERFNESRAVPSEFLADNALNAVVNDVGGDVELLFPELLKDEIPVNEIPDCMLAHHLDLRLQLLSTINLRG